MNAYKRIMVGLDLTQMDYTTMGFVCTFLHTSPSSEHIYFVHVAKDLEAIEVTSEGLAGDEPQPTDEIIKQKMKSQVEKCYHVNHEIKVNYEVLEGDVLTQLLHWSRVKHIDLIVAGKKKREKGKGLIMEKLARKSSSSILFVTESYNSAFKKILVPVDFSNRTDHVVEITNRMAKRLPNTTFVFLNIVDVPAGHTRIGKSYEEFAETMVQNARKEWQEYSKTHDLHVINSEQVYVVNEEHDVAKEIYNYAHNNQIDLIILGSRKQTDASAFLLGSVAEKLISYDYEIPLLLVKHPKEQFDFFKAIEEI